MHNSVNYLILLICPLKKGEDGKFLFYVFYHIKNKLSLNNNCRQGGRILIKVHTIRAQMIKTSVNIHI